MIKVSQISKRYRGKQVLADVCFQVNCGEIAAVVGKNGCGKSTLLKILAGIVKADSGEITYFGKNIRQKGKGYCAYVPQENPLMEQLSVRDNLSLWGRKGGQYAYVLEEFELKGMENTPVEKLSGGMKRRLSIACASLERKPILLLDEPTSALDLYYKDKIQEWIRTYREKKGIVVMTTHEPAEILQADRCFIMQDGGMRELSEDGLTMDKVRALICE